MHKNLVLIVDHGDTLSNLLRYDVLLDGVLEQPIFISPSKCSKGKEVVGSCQVVGRNTRNKRARGSSFIDACSSS